MEVSFLYRVNRQSNNKAYRGIIVQVCSIIRILGREPESPNLHDTVICMIIEKFQPSRYFIFIFLVCLRRGWGSQVLMENKVNKVQLGIYKK